MIGQLKPIHKTENQTAPVKIIISIHSGQLSYLAPDLDSNSAQMVGSKNSALNIGAKSAYSKFGG